MSRRHSPKIKNIHLMPDHELEFRMKHAQIQLDQIHDSNRSLILAFEEVLKLYEEELSERILLED